MEGEAYRGRQSLSDCRLLCILVCTLLGSRWPGRGEAQTFTDKWNRDYRLKSAYWRPYQSDQDTLGLFHLDQDPPLQDGELETEMEDVSEEHTDDAGAGALLLTTEGGQESRGGEVTDSGPQNLNAATLGRVEWAKQGRFGGGLRLDGDRGGLLTPAYPDIKRGKAGTVECWLCLEQPGAAETVVLSFDDERGKRSAVELRRGSKGMLSVACYGRQTAQTEVTLPSGEWTHLALTWSRTREVELALLVNGQLADTVTHPHLAVAFARFAGSVRVGNNCQGQAALRGTIDEVRLSTAAREYYSWDAAWTDRQAQRPVAESEPYLRDAADLLFAVSFDGTVQPTRAARKRVTS